MTFYQLFYHIVWATKYRQHILTPEVETVIYQHIRVKAGDLGAAVFALNGWTDHVHLLVSIPPAISVAKFIGQVKGVASAIYNKSGQFHPPLYWQDAYAVFSLDGKRLANHLDYIDHQKSHHANNTTITILENVFENEAHTINEQHSLYLASLPDWI